MALVLAPLAVILCSACQVLPGQGIEAGRVAASAGAIQPLQPGAVDGDGEGSAPGPAVEEVGEADDGLFHGLLSARYRYRRTSAETDSDAYLLMSLDIGDKSIDPYSGFIQGRVSQDFDGDTASTDTTFHSLDDQFDHRLHGRLYRAYVDINNIDGLERLRFGRQALLEAPEYVAFDGVHLVTEEVADLPLQLGVYGGQPDHTFETSPSGDNVAGLHATARPWQGGRVRFDWMHVEDDDRFGVNNNDLYGLGVWQNIDEHLLVKGNYSRIDSGSRDASVAAHFVDPEAALTVQVSLRQQLSTQKDLVQEFDPFFATLQEYHPYKQSRLTFWKGLGDDFDLDGGVDVRRLDEKSDIGPFNREFDRFFLTGTMHEVLDEDTSVGLTGEVWSSGGSDTQTWGLDVTHQLSESKRLSLGSYYALYKNQFLLAEEREHVRTYYARWRYRLSKSTSISAEYEFEKADLDTFQVFMARVSWRF